MKTLGILGGMGPFAGVKFYEQILKMTPAKKDWDHLRVILDSNPHIKSRTRSLLYNEESPVNGMMEACKQLEAYPVDVIAIPCNSACFFLDQFSENLSIPILNIIEITSNRIIDRLSKGKKVAVFGGYVTYITKSYTNYLQGYDYITHTEKEQETVSEIIEEIKLNQNEKALELFKDFADEYIKKYNPDVIVLGCTEFLCLDLGEDFKGTVLMDSSKILAEYVIDYCK